jgi:quercetin dioxygenase-like cupin family protein
MFPQITSVEAGEWLPGPYPGVELLVLRSDPKTGGSTVLRKFHAGVTVPAHRHPETSESVYILCGEWEEGGETYHAGTFFHAPKGAAHGPHFAHTEVVSLTVFDGPLTVEPV